MITLKHIKKIYNKGKSNEFEALHDVSLVIHDGDMAAVIGTSGAGKSTLLHIIGCIDDYDDGEYYLDDRLIKDLKEKEVAEIRNREIGIVMQDYALVEGMTAMENVRLTLDFGGTKKKEAKKRAKEALSLVGMEEYASKQVAELSGGQKQRVAIARAIVNHPKLILADEPTGALDSENTDEIIKLLTNLNEQGITIVIITHDAYVADACHRRIMISDGRIQSDSNVEE